MFPRSDRFAEMDGIAVYDDGGELFSASAPKEIAHSTGVCPLSVRYWPLQESTPKLHNSLTMPWNNNGTRLLPIKAYTCYKESIQRLMDRHDETTNRLIYRYNDHIRQAELELG